MTDPSLRHLRAVIWDIDGVKYNPADCPNLGALWSEAVGKSACAILPGLDLAEACAIATISFKRYASSIVGFKDKAGQAGVDMRHFRDFVFDDSQKNLFQTMLSRFPAVFRPEAGLIAAFQSCAMRGVQHGVASHSSMRQWAKPLLAAQGILPFFNSSAMVGWDDVAYLNKAKSAVAVRTSLKAMGADPAHAAFVEDTAHNLERAKNDIHPDLFTVYVHKGVKLDPQPDYIDLQVMDNRVFMNLMQ